jgi:hypothetical protein
MKEELAVLCAKAQSQKDCDNYVWELVNCLYGSEQADRVVKFMNSEIIKELDGVTYIIPDEKTAKPVSILIKKFGNDTSWIEILNTEETI